MAAHGASPAVAAEAANNWLHRRRQSGEYEAFVEGLRELGYVSGQTVRLETRIHGASAERAEEFARELVSLQCNVIFASTPPAVYAVMRVTRVIPSIGIDLEDDPVANGWAQSIPRPGGNLTGLFPGLPELGGKQIEFLKEAIPRLADVAVLWDATLGTAQFRATEAAIQASGVKAVSLPASTTPSSVPCRCVFRG